MGVDRASFEGVPVLSMNMAVMGMAGGAIGSTVPAADPPSLTNQGPVNRPSPKGLEM